MPAWEIPGGCASHCAVNWHNGGDWAKGYRVLRGGSWYDYGYAYGLCAAYRDVLNPENEGGNVGFRVVCGAR